MSTESTEKQYVLLCLTVKGDPEEEEDEFKTDLFKIPVEKLSKLDLQRLEEFNLGEALGIGWWNQFKFRLYMTYSKYMEENPRGSLSDMDGMMGDYGGSLRDYYVWKKPILNANERIVQVFSFKAY